MTAGLQRFYKAASDKSRPARNKPCLERGLKEKLARLTPL